MVQLRKNRRVACAMVFLIVAVLYFVLPLLFPGSALNLQFNRIQEGIKHRSWNSEYIDSGIGCEETLKVFMYDLPRRFNFGIMRRSDLEQDVPWPHDKTAPPWPAKSGLRKQHNVEYWMTVDLLGQRQETGAESRAIRVKNPEDADVFFVPFFSSLSFNTYGKAMRDPDTEYDKALQAELMDILQHSKWWQRSQGRDHVVPLHHPNSFRFLRDQLNASILIVSDFGRISANISRLTKDIVAPYTHVVGAADDYEVDPFESRHVLLYFQGQIVRKDEGIVRTLLKEVLNNHPRVHFVEGTATREGVKQATEGMQDSLFCLNPAGDTPSSCRLFDAIASHCIPVIVSDKIELPFEDELDYREFSLFFSVEEAVQPGYLLTYLENFGRERWLKMWSRLKEVAHHFSYDGPARRDDAVNMIWKQVQNKLPAVRLAINRSNRLKIKDWTSWWTAEGSR